MIGMFSAQYARSSAPPPSSPRPPRENSSQAARPKPTASCAPLVATAVRRSAVPACPHSTSSPSCSRASARSPACARTGTTPRNASRKKRVSAPVCVRCRRSRSRSHGWAMAGIASARERRRDRKRRASRKQQRDAGAGQQQLEHRAHELRTHLGQLTDLMRGMGTLRHIRRRTALKIAIRQSRDLVEEGDAQACFEPAAQAERHRGNRQLEREQDARQTDDGRHRRQSLSRQRQVRAEIDQAAEQQRLQDDARGGETRAQSAASPARASRRAARRLSR